MAARKAFIVRVQLDVQAVTCPGVWLSSNGQVSLQIYMLDSCVQTSSFRPHFPMLFHEQFAFSKMLPAKYHLEDLGKQLSREWLYIELIQWENCDCGNVLAYFQIPLNEFLFPKVGTGIPSGGLVDLLMETTPAFPGKLSPKIEVNTKTTIEETVCSCSLPDKPYISTMIKPKTMKSRGDYQENVCYPTHKKAPRNKKGRQTCAIRCRVYEKPPFRYRKVEDGFLSRRPVLDLPIEPTPQLDVDGGPDGGPYGGPRRMHPERGMEVRRIIKENIRKTLGQPVPVGPCVPKPWICTCGAGHAEACCTVCQKYSGVFSNKIAQQQPQKHIFYSTQDPDETLYKQLSKQSRKNYELYDAQQELPNPKKRFCQAHNSQGACRIVSENRESLAQKLHEKISTTLHNIPRYFDEVKERCSGAIYCETPQNTEIPCNCGQMPDMRRFYQNLFHDDCYEE